ncbi:MAG: type II toxin-antitoxin system VapC family toxin [Lachnospiraceae bacterium]|nr:type II toxin-antitoxin system VapC family toxin [Lachnospiraceae bacterium]
MRILLDTHIALWAIADTARLSDEVIKILEMECNKVFYSVASIWEVAIKHNIKPESMPISEEEFVVLCEKTGFIRLPIEADHIFSLKTLVRSENAPKHNDPFDRILLAQAKFEDLNLLTHDSQFLYYKEKCVMNV